MKYYLSLRIRNGLLEQFLVQNYKKSDIKAIHLKKYLYLCK
jgi:hypothetical protein